VPRAITTHFTCNCCNVRNWLCAQRSARSPARGRGVREALRMAYDVELADRIRAVVRAGGGPVRAAHVRRARLPPSRATWPSVPAVRAGLLLRVDPAEAESLITVSRTCARFEMRGRKMDRRLRVDAEGGRGRRRPARLGAARCHLRAFVAAHVATSRQGQARSPRKALIEARRGILTSVNSRSQRSD
jgi:hypothetical protein